MKRLKLPDESYVSAPNIKQFAVAKHSFVRKFYVKMVLFRGKPVDIETKLTLSEAEELKMRLEQQLEALHADTPAYDDGYEEGEQAGRKSGYQAGFEEGKGHGYTAGLTELEQQAQREIYGQLADRRAGLLDEMRYQAHLKEARREALTAMIKLVEDIMAGFGPPDPEAQIHNPDED